MSVFLSYVYYVNVQIDMMISYLLFIEHTEILNNKNTNSHDYLVIVSLSIFET